jgi:hypothetical protein
MPMNEAEWLASADPTPMLRFLHGRVSDRKLRLFIANYSRHTWHLFRDERCRKAIEVAERSADGQVSDEELSQIYIEISQIWTESFHVAAGGDWQSARVTPVGLIADSCRRAVRPSGRITPRVVGLAAEGLARLATEDTGGTSAASPQWKAEMRVQVDFLHELFGNPFRPSPPLPPAVLAWNDRTIPRLAQAIYEERKMPEGTFDPARLAILADALEEAGCTNADILSHLRGPGPHVRGCWVVDLILGKS